MIKKSFLLELKAESTPILHQCRVFNLSIFWQTPQSAMELSCQEPGALIVATQIKPFGEKTKTLFTKVADFQPLHKGFCSIQSLGCCTGSFKPSQAAQTLSSPMTGHFLPTALTKHSMSEAVGGSIFAAG